MSVEQNTRLEEKVDKLGSNMQSLQVDMAALKSSNEGVIAVFKATTEGNIKNLEQRVATMEATINNLVARMYQFFIGVSVTVVGGLILLYLKSPK